MINTRRVGVFISNRFAYGQEVLDGISAFCQIKNNWKLAIVSGDEQRLLGHLADHLDGVIAQIQTPEFAASLKAWGKPCVDVFDRIQNCDLPRVYYDVQALGRIGAEHLMGLGFKQFAFCGYKDLLFSQVRQRAFEEVIHQGGATCLVHNVETRTPDWASIWKGIADWVASLPKPIGLMAARDTAGLEVLEACRDLGIRVPDQVAVLGVDNNILLCQRANPSLSSIDAGIARIGFHAASLLEDMMSGKPVSNETILIPPVGVVGRASTDTLSMDDPHIAAVLRHIHEHACDPMQINDLLALVPLSRRTLEIRFFEARGRSLHEEIRRIQLQRAMRLLVQTHLPLEQVARASGFGSSEWLVRVFRKELGITPGEHRRRHGTLPMTAPA